MFYSFYSVLISLCLPIVLSLVYGTCVYFAYNKVTTQAFQVTFNLMHMRVKPRV